MTDSNTVISSKAYRERVYEAFADRSRSFEDAVETALSAGAGRLGVDIGFLTRIDDGVQYIEQSVGAHDALQPGNQCPLEEAYCRRTVELDSMLSVQNARTSSEISDAAYEAFGLGSYIGCKVVVDDEVYGTVCFADHQPRQTEFSEAEALFVELVTRLVGQGLERRAYDRKRREQTADLRAEKRRFEGIAETSFDVLFRLDTEGYFTYASTAVERVLGYEPSELVGTPFVQYLTADSVDVAGEAFEQLLAEVAAEGLELTFLDIDGTEVILEVNATAVISDGDVTAIQGVGRDITARKEREAELRVRTRAMDEAEMSITIADASHPDNTITYVNDAFETMSGYDESDIHGRNCRMLQGPKTDPDAIATLHEGIAADRPVTTELINYRKDGSPFWNRVTVTPIEDSDGTITHYLGFQQDVTERKRSEQLIGLLNRVLRHNLRNELTVIQGYADFITDPPSEVDPQAGIRNPIERLTSLSQRAHELESYARETREPRRLDVDELLASVVDDHRERFPAATITTERRTDRDICAGRELERAVSELVTNAITHDPTDDTTVSIVVEDSSDSLKLVIADDGPGIPAMESAVIETGTETTLQHGKGLGLWLVNWIVTRYGGSFQIAGGDGTIATLSLPAIDDSQSVTEAARRPTVLFR